MTLGVWLFKPPLLYLQNKKKKIEKNYFILSKHQYYEKANSYYSKQYFKPEELGKIQKDLNLIYSNEGKGNMVGPIYVGKGSNIPRHKIKEFFKEKNIKKTSLIETSSTVVFDKQVIKQLVDYYKGEEVKTAVIPYTQQIFDYIKNDYSLALKQITNSSNKWAVNNLKGKLEEMTKLFESKVNILIKEGDYNDYPLDFKKVIGDITFTKTIAVNNYRTKNISELWETIEYYLTKPHGNIIWDDVLLDSLNSDGLDMDDNYIDVLYSMFDSKETENIQLALEMLSNVNLEKHGLTVALLLNKYKMTFEWGNGNTGSQALKTLTLYFKNKGIEWKKDYRTFSTGLFNFYKNDEESTKIIKKFFIDSLNNYLDLDKDFNIQLSDINFTIIKK